LPLNAASAARCAPACAEEADARRIDAEGAGFAADELHPGKHVLHCFGKSLGFGGEPIGDSKDRDAACGKVRPPILESAAYAGDPAAAMDGDQGRRSLGTFRQILGAFRQVKIAEQFDAIVIGIDDAVVDRNAIRHFVISWPDLHAMVKRF
jgi:hypothetical protein